MTKAILPSEAVKFLRRLKWALTDLPRDDRDDIASELSVHIEERIKGGAEINDILSGFGSPEIYARSFIIEHEYSIALATRRLANLMPALATQAAKNVNALAATVLLGAMWLGAFSLAVVAIAKLFSPAHIGLWRSETEFYLGFHDDPLSASELLGFWIFPLTLCALLSAVILSRWIALYTLERK